MHVLYTRVPGALSLSSSLPSTLAVNRAYKMFDDEEQLQYCMGVAEEAKEMLQVKLEEKRKLAKKEGKTSIEEDDPIKVTMLVCCIAMV